MSVYLQREIWWEQLLGLDLPPQKRRPYEYRRGLAQRWIRACVSDVPVQRYRYMFDCVRVLEGEMRRERRGLASTDNRRE